MRSFAPQLKASQLAAGKQRERPGHLCPSEVMTILIHFHQSHYRPFKAYYTDHVQVHLSSEFPQLVSYQRFVALIASVLVPLLAYLQSRYGACTGISFIDSTSLEVCDPKCISQHRVFVTDARRGKSSMGWFYGFKLHLAVTDRGELVACCLTPGNVDDRQPVPQMVKRLRGKLFGDRGYISAPLTQMLFELSDILQRRLIQTSDFDIEGLQAALEKELLSDNEPRSLDAVARSLGYSVQILKRFFPAECQQIVARRKLHQKRRRELRQQKIQEEVQHVVLHMHAEQKYPSFNQVLKHVDRFCVCPPIFDLEAYVPWRKLLEDLDYRR